MPVRTRRNFLAGAGALATLAAVVSAGASSDWFGLAPKEYAASPVFTEGGLAIRGFDPVAYFTEGRPVAGTAEFEADWKGATWRFASAEHRDAFKADPDRYAPQYGGFCAWAVAAKGRLYSTQPSNWTIVDDRLYLNYNDAIQQRWEADIPGFIDRGDERWPEIVAEARAASATS